MYEVHRSASGRHELLTDDEGGRGRVVVLAFDRGSAWTYCWPARNRGQPEVTLVEWLRTCDLDYLAGKFGAGDWFDARATVQSIRVWLAEHEEDLSPAELDRIREDLESVGSENSWRDWVDGQNLVPDAWEHACTGVHPEFRRAATELGLGVGRSR